MPKLYFKYGAMGSSKTANALMVRFNYVEKGYKVALMKPAIDSRDEYGELRSRIGLKGKCIMITEDMNLYDWFKTTDYQVLIIDEAQFLTPLQVEQLKDVACEFVPVICFGLKTDFRTYMFPGSKRLFELADSITEIKSVCKCGRKAEVNARLSDGKIVREGNQVEIGGNEMYIGMCYNCWKNNKL